MVPEPGSVDILVAGSACVDFSALNTSKRELILDEDERPESAQQGGESSTTFRAVLRYAKDFRPRVIILENVMYAPFGKTVQPAFEEIQYAAAFVKVDTKDYCIPHTRMRLYMACVNYGESADDMFVKWPANRKKKAEVTAKKIVNMMLEVSRRASSGVEAFLLDQDDPVHEKAMRELAHQQKRSATRWDWARCHERHERIRGERNLGKKNPVFRRGRRPEFVNHIWLNRQVERIKDLLDMVYLEAARDGCDLLYKTEFFDVSQNVDRQGRMNPGITSCLTPDGLKFGTHRGALITGVEALRLQGLPTNKIHLTRETQKELLDLAGNAMTSTVVGAILLGTLTHAAKLLPLPLLPVNIINPDFSVPKSAMAGLDLVQDEMRDFTPHFGPVTEKMPPLKRMQDRAALSVRLCSCEGPLRITRSEIKICIACGATVCSQHAGSPKHHLEPHELQSATRESPAKFEAVLMRAIPTRLSLSLTPQMVAAAQASNDNAQSAEYLRVIETALADIFVFESVKRSQSWTVTYKAFKMSLKFVINKHEARWELYVMPPEDAPVKAKIRELLHQPVACMILSDPAKDILCGQWKVRPATGVKMRVKVEGGGGMIASFRQGLGLEDFTNEKVFKTIKLEVLDEIDRRRKATVDGVWQVLPRCGTANRLLHQRKFWPKKLNNPNQELFLFLDPDRLGPNKEDFVIIADDHSRHQISDTRIKLAEFTTAEGQTEPWRPGFEQSTVVHCELPGEWIACSASLSVACADDLIVRLPTAGAIERLQKGTACTDKGISLLYCEVPWYGEIPDALGESGARILHESDFPITKLGLDWLVHRLEYPLSKALDFQSSVENQGWRECAPETTMKTACGSCAPVPPAIKWTCVVKKGARQTTEMKPVEDFENMPAYEREYKNRPSPISIELRVDQSNPDKPVGTVNVHLSIIPLIHRAQAMLPYNPHAQQQPEISWRLLTMASSGVVPALSGFRYTTNKNDAEATFAFTDEDGEILTQPVQYTEIEDGYEVEKTKHVEVWLRPEQSRQLSWMIKRDRSDCDLWMESSTIESRCESLGFRLEARTQRLVRSRGGILADDVGFGKTVAMLALARATESQSRLEMSKLIPDGLITSAATVFIVPSPLIPQWYSEAVKFWPHGRVVAIRNIDDLKITRVKDMVDADIVVVSVDVLVEKDYVKRCSALAGLPDTVPLSNTRQYSSWQQHAQKRIRQNMFDFRYSGKSPRKWPRALQEQINAFESDPANHAKIPSERLKGAALQKHFESLKDESKGKGKAKEKEKAPSKDGNKTALEEDMGMLGDVTFPVFSMIRCRRMVIDEQSYLSELEIQAIKGVYVQSTWALSATPGLKDFEDVSRLASLMNVYLGGADDTKHVTGENNGKNISSQRTDREAFETRIKEHSDSWYYHRAAAAQSFLDFFLRKNIKFGGHIMSVTHIHPVIPTALERILLVEHHASLLCKDVRPPRTLEERLMTPRDRRIQDALSEGGGSPRAALLCATAGDSWYVYDHSRGMDYHVVQELHRRENCVERLSRELRKDLKHNQTAIELWNLCNRAKLSGNLNPYWQKMAELLTSQLSGAYDRYMHIMDLVRPQPFPEEGLPETLEVVLLATSAIEPANGIVAEYCAKGVRLMQEFRQRPKKAKVPDDYLDSEELVTEPPTVDYNDDEPVDEQKMLKEAKRFGEWMRDSFTKTKGDTKAQNTARRQLRFWQYAIDIQAVFTEEVEEHKLWTHCGCMAYLSTIRLNVACGHAYCHAHWKGRSETDCCGLDNCNAPCHGSNIINPQVLANFDNFTTISRGKKLEDIVRLIKSTEKDEKILIFAQYQSLMDGMEHALNEFRIPNVKAQSKGSSPTAATKLQDDFTNFRLCKDPKSKEWAKAMILNPTDATAAGHNLVSAHTVIFVSPLLTKTITQYRDYMTQAIGRVKRPGQQKSTVQVHHFVVLDTIDVNVLEDGFNHHIRLKNGELHEIHEQEIDNLDRFAYLTARAIRDAELLEEDKSRQHLVMRVPPRADWRYQAYDEPARKR